MMSRRNRWPAGMSAAVLVSVLCLLLVSAVSAAPTPPPYRGCGGVESVPVTNAAYEQQILDLLNARRGSGYPKLRVISPLQTAAELHAVDMGYDGYRDHRSMDPDPQHAGQFLTQCEMGERIAGYYASNPWAEIIAWGYHTPEDAVNGWMGSTVHHTIIMDPSFNVVGIGYYLVSGGTDTRWVVDFGVGSETDPTGTPTSTSTPQPTPPGATATPTASPTVVPTSTPVGGTPVHPTETLPPQDQKVYVPYIRSSN